jgi:uncharacterized protein (TIGR04255 family)
MDTSKKSRLYARAPIVEAIIDFRVRQNPAVSLNVLRDGFREEARKYTQMLESVEIVTELKLDGGETTVKTPVGFMYRSERTPYVLQTQLKGFTLSRLAPYEKWSLFLAEAQRLWAIYRQVASPLGMERLAVRYMNRFDLSLPVLDLARFFTVRPEAPEGGLGGTTTAFLLQLRLSINEPNAQLVLNQALVPAQKKDHLGILLDLDSFQTRDGDQLEDESLWGLIDRLHDKVEETFEACITEETRRLIQ